MAERPKWWKAFLPKKKSSGSKDSSATSSIDSNTSGDQPQPQHDPNNGFGDDTFDDSNMDSMFNEQTCRRMFKISRSGRFKDKQRMRSTLPPQETEKVAPERDDSRWQ